MAIEDWDAPTRADLMPDAIIDDDQYQGDIEATQDAFILSERRECLNVNK